MNMKRTAIGLGLAIAMLFLLSFKSNNDKIFEKIKGEWNLHFSIFYKEEGNTEETFEEDFNGIINFEKSSFTLTVENEAVNGIWWTQGEALMLLAEGDTVNFKVIKDEKSYQVWESTYDDAGMPTRVVWEMRR